MVVVEQAVQVVLVACQVKTQQIVQVKVETVTDTVVRLVVVEVDRVLAGQLHLVVVVRVVCVLFGEQAAHSLLIMQEHLLA